MGRSTREIDWESVERDYRIGALTVRQIADKHSIDKSGITNHAKKGNWTRDLSEAVRAATNAKVREAVIAEADKRRTEATISTFSAVDQAANVNVGIILGQQRRVGALNALLEKMVAEVEAVTNDPISLSAIMATLADVDPASVEALAALRTLRNRVTTLKDAAAVAAALNQEERKIFRLDEDKPVADSSIESLLAAMKNDLAGAETDS